MPLNITLNFLNISKILKPKRIIFISSAGSIYPQDDTREFNELDRTIPNNSYGEQKLHSEDMITEFVKANKVEYTILRVASAYGYDKRFSDQGVINKWLYAAINNQIIKLYNSKNSLINFISFKQIANSIKLSIEKEVNGTYNIGSNKSISLEEIILEIEKVINKKICYEILCEKKRVFKINVNKFFLRTGKLYLNEISENIKIIYEAIIKEDI